MDSQGALRLVGRVAACGKTWVELERVNGQQELRAVVLLPRPDPALGRGQEVEVVLAGEPLRSPRGGWLYARASTWYWIPADP